MLIIAERINTSRKNIYSAVDKKNTKFIQQEVINQVNAGASMIDVNAGNNVNTEIDDLKWLIEIVNKETSVPICLDSPNSKAIKEILPISKNIGLINSITGDQKKMEEILPLIKEYNLSVVGLCMGEESIPEDVSGRLDAAQKIIKYAQELKIPLEKIYLDPLVYPISTNTSYGLIIIETLNEIKKQFPEVKTITGLSNISYGLPMRKLINRTFLTMALMTGLDAAIIDPLDQNVMIILKSSLALLNKDEYCLNYINFCREQIQI
ncbi:MAG: dihydropteroate synthase [bacterium]